jgi:hypothetical protein
MALFEVRLTAPDGSAVYVYPAWVQAVRHALPNETTHTAKTKVVLSGEVVFVTETPEQVVSALGKVPT